MIAAIRKFFRDLFTGQDNATFDLGRVMLASGIGTMLVAGAVAIWRATFDFTAFGTGFGGLLVGGGAHLLLKAKTEPGAAADPNASNSGGDAS